MRTVRLILLGLLLLSGCQYYEITDPNSGRTYITDNWHMGSQRWFSGAITFTDIHNGDTVTLQSSDIKPISQERAQVDIQGGAQSDTPPPLPPMQTNVPSDPAQR